MNALKTIIIGIITASYSLFCILAAFACIYYNKHWAYTVGFMFLALFMRYQFQTNYTPKEKEEENDKPSSDS